VLAEDPVGPAEGALVGPALVAGATGNARVHDHPVPLAHSGDSSPGGFHHSGGVGPENVGESVFGPGQPPDHEEVDPIESGGLDPDPYIVGVIEVGTRYLSGLDPVQCPEARHGDRLHRCHPSPRESLKRKNGLQK
jgi:hypothetical protein